MLTLGTCLELNFDEGLTFHSRYKRSNFLCGSKQRGDAPDFWYEKIRAHEFDEVYLTDYAKCMSVFEPVVVSQSELSKLSEMSDLSLKDTLLPDTDLKLTYGNLELPIKKLVADQLDTFDNEEERYVDFSFVGKQGEKHYFGVICSNQRLMTEIDEKLFKDYKTLVNKLVELTEEKIGDKNLLLFTLT
uniref:p22 protein n=1 Tax=Little cherry virus 2 TaxID=154339 RepID=A0A517BBC4_9CLOS|nr:p22 protein [Little cherry virus 2]